MRRMCLLASLGLCFSTLAAAQTQELILPVALNGYTAAPVHYQTTIRIVNMSASKAEVTLEAYQNDGTATRILELFPVARTGTKTVFHGASALDLEDRLGSSSRAEAPWKHSPLKTYRR